MIYLTSYVIVNNFQRERMPEISRKFVSIKKSTISHTPFTDCQVHRLAILITGKQVRAYLHKPNIFNVVPTTVRLFELDVLEINILVKEANCAVEHVAVLHTVHHSECEHVQERQVDQRRRDTFLVFVTLVGIEIFISK